MWVFTTGLPTKRSGGPRFAKLLRKVCLWGMGWPFISATVSKRATIPTTSYLTLNVSACLSTKDFVLYCPLLMDRFCGPKFDQLLIQLVIVFRLVVPMWGLSNSTCERPLLLGLVVEGPLKSWLGSGWKLQLGSTLGGPPQPCMALATLPQRGWPRCGLPPKKIRNFSAPFCWWLVVSSSFVLWRCQ